MFHLYVVTIASLLDGGAADVPPAPAIQHSSPLSDEILLGNRYLLDLASALRESDLVVVGSVVDATLDVAREAKDGLDRVETVTKISIREAYHGRVGRYHVVSLVCPWGTLNRGEQTRVTTVPPPYRRVVGGGSYLLFLQRVHGSYEYSLTGGLQGAFEISGGHLVPSAPPDKSPFVKLLAGASLESARKLIVEAR